MPGRLTSGNVLVVEGKDDLHSVKNLMRAHVAWPEDSAQAPVDIRDRSNGDRSGKDAVLEDGYLSGLYKESGLLALGVVLDADTDAEVCYRRVRDRCLPWLPAIPADLPITGLIVERESSPRFGVWIMPNNISPGDLETFLRSLVPERSRPIWDHAEQSTSQAKELGAEYRDAHLAKANMHTWLAWQDPPGRPLGLAITHRVLDPRSADVRLFVDWFCTLYRLRREPA